MLSENSVDWKPCWWKNNGDDNSLRVKNSLFLWVKLILSENSSDVIPCWVKTVVMLYHVDPPHTVPLSYPAFFHTLVSSYPGFSDPLFHTKFFIPEIWYEREGLKILGMKKPGCEKIWVWKTWYESVGMKNLGMKSRVWKSWVWKTWVWKNLGMKNRVWNCRVWNGGYEVKRSR